MFLRSGTPGRQDGPQNMADPLQDRVPAPTLAPDSPRAAALASSSTASRRAVTPSVLVLRLVASSGNATPDVQPALHLAADLISAAGGTLESSAVPALTASFPNLTVAVLIARRLQWALQGLADTGVHAGAILSIRAASEPAQPPDGSPGDILLSPAAAAAVNNVPGLDLRPAGNGWQQLLWSSLQTVTPDEDEQAVLRLIRDSGREDPCPPGPVAPTPISSRAPRPIPPAARPAPTRPEPIAAPRVESPEPALAPARANAVSPAFDNPSLLEKLGPRRWFILGGAAAALLLVIVAIVFTTRRSPEAVPAPVTTSVPAPAPAATAPVQAPAPPPHVAATPKSKPSASVRKEQANSEVRPKSPALDDSACEMTESGIAHALARAENDMHSGRLEDAKAAFLKLRACSSVRDRADQDLKKVELMISTQP